MPALLWGVPAVGTLALAAAITDGARYPQTVVVLAFVGAFLDDLRLPAHGQGTTVR